ncbi:Zn finger-containing GTPase- Activating Protein for ARF [Rhizoclosmatium hyalinum]|nr:Zn finger-containing GTPase- Activating Protein for ARF [Rhizoclosmatium hyalinum]
MGGSGGGASNTFRVNDNYFAQKGAENENRRADLPPSQGGKYAGFGSTNNAPPPQPDLLADPLQALNLGWSMFTSTVSKATELVNENVIKPAATTLTDPNLTNNLSSTFNTIQKKVTEESTRGISFVQNVVKNAQDGSGGGFGGFDADDDWNDLLHKAEALKKEKSGTTRAGSSMGQSSGGFGGFGGFDDFDKSKKGGDGFDMKPTTAATGGFGGFDEFEKKRAEGWTAPKETVPQKAPVTVHNDGHQKKSDFDTDEAWEEF